MTRSVLVTGGSGFIGRNLLAELRSHDVSVVVVDRAELPPPWGTDPGVRLVRAELTEPGVIDEVLAAEIGRSEVGAIVHLAAITSVLGSVNQPVETFQNNVEVTQRLLEVARNCGVGAFVLASTNAVVGDVGAGLITSDLPLTPLTPYGATKAAAEMLTLGYAGSYGLAGCALRFTNVYGPGMGAKDSFVPRMMRAARSGAAVQVYGTGEQSRDLVHVRDVARAIWLALNVRDETGAGAGRRGFTGRAIVGSGQSVSVLRMVELVRQVTGAPLPIEHVAAPDGEMPAVRVDLSASAASIGYAPEVELAAGLAEVWQEFSH